MAVRAVLRGVVTSGRCVMSSPRLLMPQTASLLQNPALHKSHFHTSPHRYNENIINIQDPDDFKTRVVGSEKPVLIDFHATWCGPCKLLGPRLESLSAVDEGRVVLAKVDIDELQDIAIYYGVEAVPTVCAMRDGKVQNKFVGVLEQDALGAFVDKLLLQ